MTDNYEPGSKQARKQEAERKLKALNREIEDSEGIERELVSRIGALKKEREQVKNKLATLSPDQVKVSDHAVLRFIERHYGLDFEAERKKIQTAASAMKLGPNFRGAGVVVCNNTVVTYLPEGEHAKA